VVNDEQKPLVELLNDVADIGQRVLDLEGRVTKLEYGVAEDLNLSRLKRRVIEMALRKTYGNKAAAARLCGIDVKTLYNLLAKYRDTRSGTYDDARSEG
jgi:DNA-binding NtrC family response regulator